MPRTSLSLPFSSARLRQARERAGLTQEDLAKRTSDSACPVDRSSISHYEAGDRPPSAPALKSLSDALALPVDDLLDETVAHTSTGE